MALAVKKWLSGAAMILMIAALTLLGLWIAGPDDERQVDFVDGPLLSMLVMADIGHPREQPARLTYPWPMSRASGEGAFSLYEGLYDYVMRQGAKPTSVMIMGDVAYGGGSLAVNNDTRTAFQRYLNGTVADDRVFVAIGNHDVHYMGCTGLDLGTCYYGDALSYLVMSAPSMNFSAWRSSWMSAFPGLGKNTIAPPKSGDPWLAPLRYNLNLEEQSSVYFIVGLLSGVQQTNWDKETPLEARDAVTNGTMECDFVRASLTHGRSLGKSVFVYVTHDISFACEDWELLEQIDIWMYGHEHVYWQSPSGGEVVMKEQQHYPTRMMIGNGGFDEAVYDTVSFAHVTERVVADGTRIQLKFEIYDTCISDQSCPSGLMTTFSTCWTKCKEFPGGFDNGGGPRKAVPSVHGHGFVFEAPRGSVGPRAESWRLRIVGSDPIEWLGRGCCPGGLFMEDLCFTRVHDVSQAINFTRYDVTELVNAGATMGRMAVNDNTRAPLQSINSTELARLCIEWNFTDCGSNAAPFDINVSGTSFLGGVKDFAEPVVDWLYRPAHGFFNKDSYGFGKMRPSHGRLFEFSRGSIGDMLEISNLGWRPSGNQSKWQTRQCTGKSMDTLVAVSDGSLRLILENAGKLPVAAPVYVV